MHSRFPHVFTPNPHQSDFSLQEIAMETEVDKHNRMPTKQNFTAWLRNQFRFQHRLSDSIEESAIGSGVARSVLPLFIFAPGAPAIPEYSRGLPRSSQAGERADPPSCWLICVPLSFVALTGATEMPNKRPAST